MGNRPLVRGAVPRLLCSLLMIAVALAVAAGPPVPPVTPAAVATSRMAGAVRVPSQMPAGHFRWPVDGEPNLVRRFDPPPQPWLSGHRGVDLAVGPGTAVRAAGDGVVHFAGQIADRPVVSVIHDGGLRTTYEPVSPRVSAGDRVVAGDQLGLLQAGHPGCPAPACLHWGLRQGGHYLDPLILLGRGPVRLLPWSASRIR